MAEDLVSISEKERDGSDEGKEGRQSKTTELRCYPSRSLTLPTVASMDPSVPGSVSVRRHGHGVILVIA